MLNAYINDAAHVEYYYGKIERYRYLYNIHAKYRSVWTCRAKQSLIVKGSAPRIDDSVETDIQVAEGRYAVLRCIATGSPRPSIHYLKDGVLVGRNIQKYREFLTSY